MSARATKFALVLWQTCPKPCADVVHVKTIEGQMEVGTRVNVHLGTANDPPIGAKIIMLGK